MHFCAKIYLYIIDKNHNSYSAHKKLATIYEKEGGIRKCIDEYVRCIEIDKKDYDLSILDNLLNDYVIFKWKYYNSKFVDAEMIINIQRFDNRLKNIVMIIANNMNIQTIKR